VFSFDAGEAPRRSTSSLDPMNSLPACFAVLPGFLVGLPRAAPLPNRVMTGIGSAAERKVMNGNRISRRGFLRSVGAVPIWALSACDAGQPCPLCGGKLSTVGAHHDFRFLPSVNYEVWNRASDHVGCTGLEEEAPPPVASTNPGEQTVTCDAQFTSKSPLCTRCYHAYSKRDDQWTRSMGAATDFIRPLSPAIVQFPLPEKKYIRYGAGYFQTFGGWSGTNYRLDELRCWLSADMPKPLMDVIGNYAKAHQLQLKLGPSNDSGLHVHATYSEGHPPENPF
jgi:hypothetical protein